MCTAGLYRAARMTHVLREFAGVWGGGGERPGFQMDSSTQPLHMWTPVVQENAFFGIIIIIKKTAGGSLSLLTPILGVTRLQTCWSEGCCATANGPCGARCWRAPVAGCVRHGAVLPASRARGCSGAFQLAAPQPAPPAGRPPASQIKELCVTRGFTSLDFLSAADQQLPPLRAESVFPTPWIALRFFRRSLGETLPPASSFQEQLPHLRFQAHCGAPVVGRGWLGAPDTCPSPLRAQLRSPRGPSLRGELIWAAQSRLTLGRAQSQIVPQSAEASCTPILFSISAPQSFSASPASAREPVRETTL